MDLRSVWCWVLLILVVMASVVWLQFVVFNIELDFFSLITYWFFSSNLPINPILLIYVIADNDSSLNFVFRIIQWFMATILDLHMYVLFRFVAVEKLKDQFTENNKQICWVPDYVKVWYAIYSNMFLFSSSVMGKFWFMFF